MPIAAVAAVLDPELVVLGGGIGTGGGDLLLRPMSEALAAISPFTTRLEVSTLGVDAVIAGCTTPASRLARSIASSAPTRRSRGRAIDLMQVASSVDRGHSAAASGAHEGHRRRRRQHLQPRARRGHSAASRDRLDITDVVLHDVDPDRLEVVGGRRAADRSRARVLAARLTLHGRPRRGGRGGIGGAAADPHRRPGARYTRRDDPAACGCVGQETTGAGGFAKALRTVPVVLDIAERVRRHAADDAWIVDFTNPVGIVTRALLDHGHRALGLCNVAIGFQRLFAGWLEVSPESVHSAMQG